ncbi:MAG: hypothetical protein HC828_04835 [Blastochloris sp.]|nr:hypothetical protein [Blastochloris sp.]
MEDTLQVLAMLLTVLLIMAVPLYAFWDLRRANRRLVLENDQLAEEADRWQTELERTLHALTVVQRQAVLDYRDKPHPMQNPPAGIRTTLERLNRLIPRDHDPYAFVVGWETRRDVPGILALSLNNAQPNKSGQILITGEPGNGKTSLSFLLMATICMRTTIGQFRLFIIDPKRVDGAFWKGKAHNWREPILGGDDREAIAVGMTALRREREARERLIEDHKVSQWSNLPMTVRPPLLLVYVSELSILRLGTDDLEGWLISELTAARASGIVYMLDTQTVSNMKTGWRSMIGTFLALGQSSRTAVEPNIGLTHAEIEELGGTPPHKLPDVGYITARSKRQVATVRAPYIDDAERWRVLEALPNAPEALDPLRRVLTGSKRRAPLQKSPQNPPNRHWCEAPKRPKHRSPRRRQLS